MSKMAWSWSRLNLFETCALKFYLQNIAKVWKYVQSPAAKRGEELHKKIRDAAHKVYRVLSGKCNDAGYPEEIMHVVPLLYKLLTGADDFLVEEGSDEPNRYALDEQFKKVDYFNAKAWLRFGIDFAVKHGKAAVCVDWKTGKNYGYNDQLKLMAAILMEVIWPDVDEVTACYVYIDQNETSMRKFYRKDLDDMWDDLMDRASAIDRAVETNSWPCQRNPFCKNCEATAEQCEIKREIQ